MRNQLLMSAALLTAAQAVATSLTYEVSGTAGGYTLSGTVVFAGPLGTDGAYDFLQGGSPLTAASLNISGAGINNGGGNTGGNGTYYFDGTGLALSNPSFTVGGVTFTNLPNQNDAYELTSGALTGLKYDLSSGISFLQLSLSNHSYSFGEMMSTTEAGSYLISSLGNNLYSLTGTQSGSTLSGTFQLPLTVPPSEPQDPTGVDFTTLPNQNDDYLVSGGNVTAMKYDLNNGQYSLMLGMNGTFMFSDMMTNESGTYSMTAVPEPSTYGMILGGLALAGAALRRRRIK